MSIREFIHGLFEITESHELPSKMMAVLFSDSRDEALNKYKERFPDLSHDYLRDYFQENQADRSNLMQDYTPDSICQIVAGTIGHPKLIADICAGTGSLTLEAWNHNREAEFICYELSSASIPFLLFNLLVRKVKAWIVHGDVLTEEVQKIYRVQDGAVEIVEAIPQRKVDAVITNPPYSLKWSGDHDLRFGIYDSPPSSKADFAFFLIGLDMLKDDGVMTAVFPHGVLFRGNAEGKIRQALIETKTISTIVGLPGKLFAETQIPTCLMITGKADDGILIIDGSQQVDEKPKQSIMSEKHIQTVLSAFTIRKDIEKLSHLASYQELQANDYNLNIPRYVDTFEDEILPPPWQTMEKILENEQAIRDTNKSLLQSMENLVAVNPQVDEDFQRYMTLFRQWATI